MNEDGKRLARHTRHGRASRRAIVGAGFGLALAALGRPAAAQDYPQRPVRMVVPFTAAGIVDILARELGNRLAPRLGQPVVVENRTGASGSIGTEFVARAAPDGHTLLLASGVITINAAMRGNLPWHPVDSFAPIAMLAVSPQVIVVHPKIPANTLQQLLAYARTHPGKLDFGSVGNGSTPHLTIELLKSLSGTSMVHIPYRGQPEVLADLAQGNIALTSVTVSLAESMIRSGQLRPLAVTTLRRARTLPDVPTVAEAGLPSFDVPNWFGVVGPRGMPQGAIQRLHTEIARIGAEADFVGRLAQLGVEPSIVGPDEFARFVRDDLKRWNDVVRRAGLAAQ